MNCIFNLSRLTTTAGGLYNTNPIFWVSIRNATHKTGTSCRNAKQAPGKHKAIKIQDGRLAYPMDLVASQHKLNFHPGLNVKLYPNSKDICALKKGIVRITCEKADLKEDLGVLAQYHPDRDPSVPIFKKYIHVIPKPQHNWFRLVDQI